MICIYDQNKKKIIRMVSWSDCKGGINTKWTCTKLHMQIFIHIMIYSYQSKKWVTLETAHVRVIWIRIWSSHVVVCENKASDVTDHMVLAKWIKLHYSASLRDASFFWYNLRSLGVERHITTKIHSAKYCLIIIINKNLNKWHFFVSIAQPYFQPRHPHKHTHVSSPVLRGLLHR